MDPSVLDILLHALTGFGLPGVLIAYVVWDSHRRHLAATAERIALAAELRAERDARIDDAREQSRVLLEVQDKTHETVERVNDLVTRALEAERRERGSRPFG